jgi:hypothetical protein
MKKHLLLLLSVVCFVNTHSISASQSSKSFQLVVLDFQDAKNAAELKASVLENHFQILEAPEAFDRTQLISYRADQIRHALEQKNAVDDKPDNKSYYLVLDFQQLENLEDLDSAAVKGWKATVDGYLYKLDKSSSSRRLYKTEFPMTYVASVLLPMVVSRPIGKVGTREQLLKELVQKSFDLNLDSLQKSLFYFADRIPISQVHPIGASIRNREGIRTDDRFFAYNYVYNTKTSKTEKVFRGVVRATNHIINYTEYPDSFGITKFYQTYGLKLVPGNLLERKKNSGYELSLMHSTGSVQGWSGRLDLRMSRHTGIPSMFIYLEAGKQDMVPADTRYMHGPYTLYRFEGGLAKGIQLNPLMELRPYAGIGQESNVLGYNYGFFAEYYKLGANLSLTVLPCLQVFGGYGYYHFMNIRNTYDMIDLGVPWSVCFPNRDGGNIVFGVRLEL